MLQRTLPAGFIAPCLPTKTTRLPSGGQWLHEIKHDGFRIIARKSNGRVRLYSRPGNDFTRRFPLIVEALARLRSRSCIIAGPAAQRMEKWGGWKPHRIGEITYPAYPPGGTYPIDLETLTSSAEVLDMICQVAMKEWATDGCISGLVRAINDLLQPQAHLCSMGADRRLHGDEIVRLTKWAREQVKYK
jgi:ATP dependent DNA ligase domain